MSDLTRKELAEACREIFYSYDYPSLKKLADKLDPPAPEFRPSDFVKHNDLGVSIVVRVDGDELGTITLSGDRMVEHVKFVHHATLEEIGYDASQYRHGTLGWIIKHGFEAQARLAEIETGKE